MLRLLADPKAFNVLLIVIFALAAVRWTFAGNIGQALYHFGAVILNVAVTFMMGEK